MQTWVQSYSHRQEADSVQEPRKPLRTLNPSLPALLSLYFTVYATSKTAKPSEICTTVQYDCTCSSQDFINSKYSHSAAHPRLSSFQWFRQFMLLFIATVSSQTKKYQFSHILWFGPLHQRSHKPQHAGMYTRCDSKNCGGRWNWKRNMKRGQRSLVSCPYAGCCCCIICMLDHRTLALMVATPTAIPREWAPVSWSGQTPGATLTHKRF